MIFKNIAPDDKEWSAHVKLLNDWTDEDTQLRHVVGYIQSGPHYPKHMHQDLIEQYFNNRLAKIKLVVMEKESLYSGASMYDEILEEIDKQKMTEANR